MKRTLLVLFGLMLVLPLTGRARAQEEEPTVYVIQQGDTLWGLSGKFMNDPYYWPNLWATNQQKIGNPHFIFPGQKLKIHPDRIEIEEKGEKEAAPAPVPPAPAPVPAPAVVPPPEKPAIERTFVVTGGEGFLQENDLLPAGYIISTQQNRQIVGEDDIVYTDIGRAQGAKVGDRYSVFKKMDAVSHPVTNEILGYRVVPLGTLQLTELEEKSSRAIITKSYEEIGPGSFLMPYRNRRRTIALKAPSVDLNGYIVETRTGNKTVASGDIVYLDLGRINGLEEGNMLYVIRDVEPDPRFIAYPVGKLPAEVIGALVVVETGEHTSTALVVKSIDTIYRGDRVEMRRNR